MKARIAVASVIAVVMAALLIAFGSEEREKSASSVVVLSENDTYGRMTVDLDTVPVCSSCIAVELNANFGSFNDSILPAKLPRIARDRQGRTFALVPGASQIVVYSQRGHARGLGNVGDGPGEFRRVEAFGAGPDGTLAVFHDRSRLTLFDSDLKPRVTNEVPVRIAGEFVPLADKRFVVSGALADRRETSPLHLLTEDGQHVRSFGTPGMLRGLPRRILTLGPNGSLFAGEFNNYRIEQTDTTGVVVRTIGIRPPRSWHTREIMTPAVADSMLKASGGRRVNVSQDLLKMPRTLPHAPAPQMTGLYASSDLLWIAWNVPKPGWESVPVTYRPSGGDINLTDLHYSDVYRTAVDVVDIETGRLLARTYINGYAQLTNDGALARRSYSPDGVVVVEVFTLSFNITRGGRR